MNPMPDTRWSRRRWLILGIVGLAQLMVVLDLTVLNIALPSAQRALHFSTADRQWVVTAYTLAFGSLLLPGGKLADLLGPKATFLAGLIGFAGVSVIGGVSVDFGMLIAARAGQGAFAALLVPSALSLLTTTFSEPRERGRAFGLYGAISMAGSAAGLLLGGALTEYLNWRFLVSPRSCVVWWRHRGQRVQVKEKSTMKLTGKAKVVIAAAVVAGGLSVGGFAYAATTGGGAAVAPAAGNPAPAHLTPGKVVAVGTVPSSAGSNAVTGGGGAAVAPAAGDPVPGNPVPGKVSVVGTVPSSAGSNAVTSAR